MQLEVDSFEGLNALEGPRHADGPKRVGPSAVLGYFHCWNLDGRPIDHQWIVAMTFVVCVVSTFATLLFTSITR